MSHSPIRAPKDSRGAGDRTYLVRIRLDSDPGRELDAQEMIDYLEALRAGRVVGSADVHQLLVLALRMVSKESQNGYHRARPSVERQLVLVDLKKPGKRPL